MGKFERKTKEERRKEIMEAAKDIFFHKGYRNTTMEDVVAKTSLSKGGVYQYYKSTKAIMFDIMQSGNYFRYQKTEQIIKENIDNGDVFEVFTKIVMSKMFEPVLEKKLYLMFLTEILYDKDSEDLFFQLEKQSFELAVENFKIYYEKYPELKIFKKSSFENSAIKFFFRIFNGILIVYELFSDKEVFTHNMDKMHDLIYHILKVSAESGGGMHGKQTGNTAD